MTLSKLLILTANLHLIFSAHLVNLHYNANTLVQNKQNNKISASSIPVNHSRTAEYLTKLGSLK